MTETNLKRAAWHEFNLQLGNTMLWDKLLFKRAKNKLNCNSDLRKWTTNKLSGRWNDIRICCLAPGSFCFHLIATKALQLYGLCLWCLIFHLALAISEWQKAKRERVVMVVQRGFHCLRARGNKIRQTLFCKSDEGRELSKNCMFLCWIPFWRIQVCGQGAQPRSFKVRLTAGITT